MAGKKTSARAATGRSKERTKRAASASSASAASRPSSPAEKPVSLAPLEFEEALKGLLKVKPDRKTNG